MILERTPSPPGTSFKDTEPSWPDTRDLLTSAVPPTPVKKQRTSCRIHGSQIFCPICHHQHIQGTLSGIQTSLEIQEKASSQGITLLEKMLQAMTEDTLSQEGSIATSTSDMEDNE